MSFAPLERLVRSDTSLTGMGSPISDAARLIAEAMQGETLNIDILIDSVAALTPEAQSAFIDDIDRLARLSPVESGQLRGGIEAPVRYAQAATGTMSDASPAKSAPKTSAGTGVRPGSLYSMASQALQSLQRDFEKTQTEDAMGMFRLNANDPTDVNAARAYVWARNILPVTSLGANVPTSGALNREVAAAVMRNELMNPGTVGLASRGNPAAMRVLDAVIEGAITLHSRPTGISADLQTTSVTARKALTLTSGDQLQAHHLVPAEIWGKFGVLAALAAKDGWSPENPTNLIALPATTITQAKLAAVGMNLPLHNGSHSDYNVEVRKEMLVAIAERGGDTVITSVEARAIFESVSNKFRADILSGRWHPRLH